MIAVVVWEGWVKVNVALEGGEERKVLEGEEAAERVNGDRGVHRDVHRGVHGDVYGGVVCVVGMVVVEEEIDTSWSLSNFDSR
jgi:hypothetical protein